MRLKRERSSRRTKIDVARTVCMQSHVISAFPSLVALHLWQCHTSSIPLIFGCQFTLPKLISGGFESQVNVVTVRCLCVASFTLSTHSRSRPTPCRFDRSLGSPYEHLVWPPRCASSRYWHKMFFSRGRFENQLRRIEITLVHNSERSTSNWHLIEG